MSATTPPERRGRPIVKGEVLRRTVGKFCKKCSNGSGWSQILAEDLDKSVAEKYCKEGRDCAEIVRFGRLFVNECDRTLCSVNPWILLQRHNTLTEYEILVSYITKIVWYLPQTNSLLLISDALHVDGYEKLAVLPVFTTYPCKQLKWKSIYLRRRFQKEIYSYANVWDRHLVLSEYYLDKNLFWNDKGCYVKLLEWKAAGATDSVRLLLTGYNGESLYGIIIKKFNIQHKEDEKLLFPLWSIVIREIVMYYYSSLVYPDLWAKKQFKYVWVKSDGSKHQSDFKWPFNILDTVVYKSRVPTTARVLQDLFCEMPYVNYATYFNSYETTNMWRGSDVTRNNVWFLHRLFNETSQNWS